MTKPAKPEDLFADLLHDRLYLVAATAAKATNSAFARADEEAGDSTLGVVWTGLDRTRNLLRRMAGVESWLSFWTEQGLAYSLRVGSVPIRLSRSDKELPRVYGAEREQLNLNLDQLPPEHLEKYPNGVLRLEMRYPQSGPLKDRRVTSVELRYVNELTDKEYCSWQIWSVDADGTETVPTPPTPPTPSAAPMHVPPDPVPPAGFDFRDDKENEASGD